MSSWKKTGGINYSSKFNTIRVQNAVASSSSVIKEIGEKNTVTNIKSDLHFKEDSSLFSVENVLDNRGLVAFYEFTDISGADTQLGTNGVIENKATFDYGNDLGQFDHSILDLEIVDISGADISGNKDIIEVGPNKDLQVENILVPDSLLTEKAAFTHFNKFLRFEGKTPENPTAAIMVFNNTPCKSLISKQTIDFNNYHVTDLITGGERTDPDMSLVSGKYIHHNTLSVVCWMRINKYDSGDSNPTDPTGFMLFSLDDDVQGAPTQGDERLCFWAPGYENRGTPQVHFGGLNKSGNGLGSQSNEDIIDINVQTDVQIPYNKWTLISLVVKGNRAYIYQEADGIHKLTQEIYIGDYRLPEKKIIVNGTRFYNMDIINDGASADWIPNNTQTSTMSIDIADFKVYNYAIDSHTIKRLYEHDNPFFNETVNFRIEPNYMRIGNDVVVGNDAHINHDLTISNDLKTFGVSETYNNAFVAGSLGVGVKEHDPDYRLNVLGNLKTSGDIYLGDGSADYNAIYFRGVGSSNGEHPSTTRIIEKTKYDDPTKIYSELLLSKGTDVVNPDIIDGKLISDSIRLRAPNVYIDTFDSENGTDPNEDTSRFVFSKDGFLGIKSVEPKAELDIRGTIHLTDDNTFNNIFITNEGTNVSSGNKPARNIGIGQGVLQTPNFGSLQGDNNVAIGPESSSILVTGSNNVAVGNKTLKNNISGFGNIAIGNESLINSNTDNNIALGNQSGLSTISGSNNIFLGNQASAADGVVDPTVTTPVTIEADSIENSIAIGKGAKISRCNGANIANDTNNLFVGINNPQPKYNLDVSGNLNISGSLRINKVVFQVPSNGDGEEGDNQLSLSSGILSQGPNIITDKTGFLTISDSDPRQKNNFVNDHNYDFQVVNRNMKFSNYPPSGQELNLYPPDDLPFESPSFAFEYTENGQTIPDYPIYFDGNITFIDNYNNDRQTDKGFNVKSMDANFDQNLTINKKLIIQNLNQTYEDTINGPTNYEAFVVDPGKIETKNEYDVITQASVNPTMISNVDTTFTNDVSFNEYDLSGNPNVVNFNGKNVNFTHVDGEVNIIKDLVVNGNVKVNGSITREPGVGDDGRASTLTGDQDIYGKVKIIQDDFAVSDDFVDIGFDVSANTHIRGHLTVDGDFNFEKAVLKNMIQEDHQTIRMSERVIIDNHDTNIKTIQITLSQNQADILNGSSTIVIPLDEGTITIPTGDFIIGTSSNLQISGGSGSGAIVDVVMTDSTTIQSITVTTPATTQYNVDEDITISTTLYIDAPALHVTQHGNNHNIAEFYDGDGDKDEQGNSLKKLVMRVANEGVTDIYGRLGINQVPESGYDLDVLGKTRIKDETRILNNVYIGSTEETPLCTLDISANDAIRIPVGNNEEKPEKYSISSISINKSGSNYTTGDNITITDSNSNTIVIDTITTTQADLLNGTVTTSTFDITNISSYSQSFVTGTDLNITSTGSGSGATVDVVMTLIGMLRYNNVLGQIEYYGKGTKGSADSVTTQDADDWQNIAAGGRITSTHNAYISVGVDDNNNKPIERLMVDTDGNVRIGKGRKDANARLHIDGGSSNDAVDTSTDFIMLRRGDADSNNNNNFTKISSRKTSSGEAIDIKTNTSSSEYKALTILPEGQIGMGTNNPSGNLHVIDSSDCDVIFESGNNQTSTLKLKDAANGDDTGDSASFEYDGSANKINIYHTSDNNTQKMTMIDSGYIGIGTMSPATRLHINETNNSDVLRLTNVNNNSITHQADFKLGKYYNEANSSMLELKLHPIKISSISIHTTAPEITNYTKDDDITITDSIGNTIVIDTITATQAALLNGTDTTSTFDITNISSYSQSFVTGTGLSITSTGSGSGAKVDVTITSPPTIMRLRSDGKVGINVADNNIDSDCALQVTDGDIVLGSGSDKDNKIKIIGTKQETTLEHDTVSGGNGNFEIKVTPKVGNDTTQTTPLSIGQRDVTFDVSDSSNTSEDGSFDISGGEFNFTGRTFKINDLTIDASILLITINTSGSNYTTDDDITITDSIGNTIVIDTITTTQADLLNGTVTTSTFDITNISSYSQSFVTGTGTITSTTGSGSGAKVDVTVTTKLQTTNNNIEIVNSDGNKIEIDASGVNIGLNNTNTNSDVFSVGTTFTVDTSGHVYASGNIVASGTGKFGDALIDGSSNASNVVFGHNSATNKAITQTSGGATTLDGATIDFNITGSQKANIDSSGKFTIGNSSITSGTAQFNNGGLHVSSGSIQNLIITTITIHTLAITNYTTGDDITITDSNGNTIVIDTITATQAALLNGTDTTSTFDITNISSYSQSFVTGTGLSITSTGSGSGAKVDVVLGGIEKIGNKDVDDQVHGRIVLYDASKNSFGVEVDDVYISNKKFHVTGENTSSTSTKAPKGMLINPFDSQNQIVTIEGNLHVNGKVSATEAEASITATSIAAAVEGIGHSTDQLYIGGNENYIANTSKPLPSTTYLTIAGNPSQHSMWAYGPVVSEEYFAATSDINLKENIFTINSALDKTNRMRGVYFNKKGSDKREVGVIAQEVEKVFPELVTGEEGKKTVAYANLTGVLIEAVKELSRENTSQATEIDSLKAKVDGLTNNIQQLWEHKRTDDNRMKNELAELKREIQHMKRNK